MNNNFELRKHFFRQLEELYNSERTLLKLLPDIIDSTSCKALRDLLKPHKNEISQQIKMLEEISGKASIVFNKKKCEVLGFFMCEFKEVIGSDTPQKVKDTIIMSLIYRINNYRTALYNTLLHFARKMGEDDIEDSLEDCLINDEEISSELYKIIDDYSFRKLAAA
jgi:ferritin-like metal-binding protein YciE